MQRRYGNAVETFLPEVYWTRKKDFFAYNIHFDDLAASATAQAGQFEVENASDFLCLSLGVTMANAAGTTEVTFLTAEVRMIDSSSGQAWTYGRMQLSNLFMRMGINGDGPFVLPFPRFCPAGSTQTAELTNLTATAADIWLTFHGVKIYNTFRGGA